MNNNQYINKAINFNGNLEPFGFNDLGEACFNGGLKENYISAVEYFSGWGGGDYDYIKYDVIRGRQLTKLEFKKEYSLYRKYLASDDKEKWEIIEKFETKQTT